MDPAATSQAATKYLTVTLADESYGLAVLKVREIIRLQKITPMPQTPEFVKGVINLRGRVVPVIDLRLKFGLPAAVTERTCIVVAQVGLRDQRAISLGLVVDAVEEVVNLAASEIAPPPDFGSRIDTSYLLGLARVKDRVKLLLDIDRVVAPETAATLATAV